MHLSPFQPTAWSLSEVKHNNVPKFIARVYSLYCMGTGTGADARGTTTWALPGKGGCRWTCTTGRPCLTMGDRGLDPCSPTVQVTASTVLRQHGCAGWKKLAQGSRWSSNAGVERGRHPCTDTDLTCTALYCSGRWSIS